MISDKQRTELAKKQVMLKILYQAWLAEKRKYISVYVGDEHGNIVELQPDGTEKIVGYTQR